MDLAITWASVLCLGAAAAAAPAGLTLATDGRIRHEILVARDAPAPEKHAAEELAGFLAQVVGRKPPLRATIGTEPVMAVGPVAARQVDAQLNLDGLGADGIVMRTRGRHLILTGGPGAPRGTLYAVYTFLEDVVGCRWWTPAAGRIPSKPDLRIPKLDMRYVPVLEYREPFYFHAFDGDWAVRNKSNGHRPQLDAKRGGKIRYQGFVHTFYSLVPPKDHFRNHPEWYSQIKGKRTHERAQLCLTNEKLQELVVGQVKTWLRQNPSARIVSVSQNDWHGRCQCAACRAVEAEEGSPSGPLLRFVNAVAAGIEKDHPNVAISTLAYQYTRKPPRQVRPRPNVIVRLCSIECSFAHPLAHERNQSFREDIAGWSKVCKRLYVWDYVTNFRNYVQPHPNLRVLGPNVRFFVKHSVRGLFEQGNYQSYGGEFAELRAWVLAKLLWDPRADDRALIEEFLAGYYEAAAPQVRRYIELMHDKAKATDVYLRIGMTEKTPFLTPEILLESERIFRQAEQAVRSKPDVLKRVEVAHLPVRYVAIVRWPELEAAGAKLNQPWPFPKTRAEAIADFERVCRENRVTRLSEWGGRRVSWLREQFLKPAQPKGK